MITREEVEALLGPVKAFSMEDRTYKHEDKVAWYIIKFEDGKWLYISEFVPNPEFYDTFIATITLNNETLMGSVNLEGNTSEEILEQIKAHLDR